MLIDFENTQKYNQAIDLVDPGNCCIKAENDDWQTYYLITKTIRGVIHFLEFGPIAPDTILLIENFNVNYSSMKFNEKKVYRRISSFLNDPKKKITSATNDLEDNAFDDFPDVIELFKGIN